MEARLATGVLTRLESAARRSGLVRPFRVRDFRFLWGGDVLMGWAEEAEMLVLSWFVLVSTGSAGLLGLFASLRFSGNLFAPVLGVLADRFPRRTLFLIVRGYFALSASTILALSATGRLQVWHLFPLIGLVGVGRAMDAVLRNSLIADSVPREALINATALDRISRNMRQMVGPVTAGLVLGHLGMTGAYVMAVSLHGVGLALTSRLRVGKRRVAGSGRGRSALTAGLSYVVRHPVVLALVLVALLVNLTAFPLNNGLMPLFARNVLNAGPQGLAWLLVAYSAGAFLGSLTVGSLHRLRWPGRFLLGSTAVWHLGLLVFAQSRHLGLSLGLLVLSGVFQSFTMVSMAMLLLSTVPAEMRGRVLGVRSLAVYGLPLSLMALGFASDRLGAPLTMSLSALSGVALTALVALAFPRLWRLR